MRNHSRAILPVAFAAIFMVLSVIPASAVEHHATPISEPESTLTRQQSSLNQPQQQAEPIVTYSHSESILGLPTTTDFHFTISYDFTGYDFGIPAEDVTIEMYLDTGVPSSIPRRISVFGPTASQTYTNDNIFRANLAQACRAGEGFITAQFDVYAYENGDRNNRLYDHEGPTQTLECTVQVTPEAPSESEVLCGPGNNTITIPDQPIGVLVDDPGWNGTSRYITYTPAPWAFFPPTFHPIFTYTDNDDDCEATASITGPATLYRLEPGSQIDLSGTYDVSDYWPENGSLNASVTIKFGLRESDAMRV